MPSVSTRVSRISRYALSLGLPPALVERQHELTAQPLPERVLRDQELELAHQIRGASEREVRVDPLLEGEKP